MKKWSLGMSLIGAALLSAGTAHAGWMIRLPDKHPGEGHAIYGGALTLPVYRNAPAGVTTQARYLRGHVWEAAPKVSPGPVHPSTIIDEQHRKEIVTKAEQIRNSVQFPLHDELQRIPRSASPKVIEARLADVLARYNRAIRSAFEQSNHLGEMARVGKLVEHYYVAASVVRGALTRAHSTSKWEHSGMFGTSGNHLGISLRHKTP